MVRKDSSFVPEKNPTATPALDKPKEFITGHSHLVIKSGSQKKNK